jgi:hypothetical protein
MNPRIKYTTTGKPSQRKTGIPYVPPAQVKKNYLTLPNGQRISPLEFPKNKNCDECWDVWLGGHPSVVKGFDEYIVQGKRTELVDSFGTKIVKQVERYIVNLLAAQKAA